MQTPRIPERRPPAAWLVLAALLLLPLPMVFAQAAARPVYTEGLEGVDLSGLSEAERILALKVLNQADCTCGCGMSVAQCRVEDQSCPRSPLLARAIVDAVRRGLNEDGVWAAYQAAAARSRVSRGASLGNSATRGNPAAPVTILEFSGFQCPLCTRADEILEGVLAEFPEQVRIVYKHLPLSVNPQAEMAARAAEAAGEQGKFWEMYEILSANPESLQRGDLLVYAQQLGLDVKRFESAMSSPAMTAKIETDAREAKQMGVTSAPVFFVNSERLPDYLPETFRRAIQKALGKVSAN